RVQLLHRDNGPRHDVSYNHFIRLCLVHRQGSNRSDPTSIKSSCESEAVPGKTLSAPRLFAHFRALSSTGSNFAVQTSKEVRPSRLDRKSTRLNSSHVSISYAVFCLKKKN